MARQHIANVWANAGATADPGASKKDLGWEAEVPPHQWFNHWQNVVDQMLEHIEKFGIAQWDAATTYEVDGLALGSDGVVYQAVLAQANNDPTVDDGTNWRSLVCDGDFTAAGGYVIFNSRPALIIQWGLETVGGNLTDTEYSVALPIAFPTAFAVALAADDVTVDDEDVDIGARPNGLSAVYLQNAEDVPSPVRWLAIGW